MWEMKGVLGFMGWGWEKNRTAGLPCPPIDDCIRANRATADPTRPNVDNVSRNHLPLFRHSAIGGRKILCPNVFGRQKIVTSVLRSDTNARPEDMIGG